jgi:predicted ATP-grasp superfamily ATP-dependent carboligase
MELPNDLIAFIHEEEDFILYEFTRIRNISSYNIGQV